MRRSTPTSPRPATSPSPTPGCGRRPPQRSERADFTQSGCRSWFSVKDNGRGLSDLERTRQAPNIIEYRFKNTPPSFADIPVESLHLSTVDDQFARVTIRYRGEDTHKKILAYLESEFGRMERLPGQMLRGLNQQYNWRGTESEINLTYQAGTGRGYLFLDSRTLAPRFNDLLADTAE